MALVKEFNDVVDKIKTDEFILKVRKAFAQEALSPSMMRVLSRVVLEEVVLMSAVKVIRAVLEFATQEEPIKEIPADWWQHFKLRWFPRWLKRWLPVQMKWVVAIHKWPELMMPSLGREYVHLTVVDTDKLIKELEEND